MQIQIQIHRSKQMKKKNIVKGTKDPDIKCLNICTNDDFGTDFELPKNTIRGSQSSY